MSVLIIHHLEPTWAADYKEYSGDKWDFYSLSEAVAEHIEQSNYDQVILTQFERTELDGHDAYWPIRDKVDIQHEYGYGWDITDVIWNDKRSMAGAYNQLEEVGYIIGDGGQIWARGGAHSELVRIDEWMEKLPKKDVYICGAFDGSCVEDLEKALDFLAVEYKRVEELII